MSKYYRADKPAGSVPDGAHGVGSDRGDTAASDALRGLLDALTALEVSDHRLGGTFSIQRLSTSYEALTEAIGVSRLAHQSDERASTQIIHTVEKIQKTLTDLEKAPSKGIQDAPQSYQLAAVVADRLALFLERNAERRYAEHRIVGIIKSLSKISGLGKVSNVDETPDKIERDTKLTPLQRFCLLGCLRSYYGALAAEGRIAQYERKCFLQQITVAHVLIEKPPRELNLLNDTHPRAADTTVPNLALSLFVESIFAASESSLHRGHYYAARNALDPLKAYSGKLNEETLRAWLTRKLMVCRALAESGEVELASDMFQEAAKDALELGPQFTPEALRFQAGQVKAAMGTATPDNHSDAESIVATFLSKFRNLDDRAQLALIDEALVVYQASVTLSLFKVEEEGCLDPQDDPIDRALRTVADMKHLLERATALERFRMVESLLDIAQVCSEYGDPESRQLHLIQQASELLDQLEQTLDTESLYHISMCRAQVAQTLVMSDAGCSDAGALKKLAQTLIQNAQKLSAACSERDIEEHVKQAYHRAQVVVLSSLAQVLSVDENQPNEAGLSAIKQAIKLYDRSMDPLEEPTLGRALLEQGKELAERNDEWQLASQYAARLAQLL
jgi:hypothetical protein